MQGMTYHQIANLLGISPQRVQQLTRPNKQVFELLLKRAGNKCEQCGIHLYNRGHVHHKLLPSIPLNRLDNLMYLCISCHLSIHHPPKPKVAKGNFVTYKCGHSVKATRSLKGKRLEESRQFCSQINCPACQPKIGRRIGSVKH